MKILSKTISFMVLAMFAVADSHAVSVRPTSNTNSSSRRTSTVSALMLGTNASGVISSVSQSALLTNKDCIESYTECIEEVCGETFASCTTNELFHAQMPKCTSTLYQCSSSGIESLFGSGATAMNLSTLSNSVLKRADGTTIVAGDEDATYVYPKTNSLMAQRVSAGAIENRYKDDGTCVKEYTKCLHKDSVCGEDFELCTDNKSFKKQAITCESYAVRCKDSGRIDLFGSSTAYTKKTPESSSRLGEMIKDGAELAAANAVSTCFKVIDNCFLSACKKNPYKCYVGANKLLVEVTESINTAEDGTTTTTRKATYSDDSTTETTAKDVRNYLSSACLDVVGANRYCYATLLNDGKMPTSAELQNPEKQSDVFEEAYQARMSASSSVPNEISNYIADFRKKAADSCYATIEKCAISSCGGGNAAVCYKKVFGKDGTQNINKGDTYDNIKAGCEAIINTDANCQYAAIADDAAYTYKYNNETTFDNLFPAYSDTESSDPVGAVAKLNALLAGTYNETAINNMYKSCQNSVKSCVKSKCGTDYANCYRNRSDVSSNLTKTDNGTLNASMNKVGGILDYTVTLGLCVDTIKNSKACEDSLAIAKAEIISSEDAANVWGGNAGTTTLRSSWLNSSAGATATVTSSGLVYSKEDANGNPLCTDPTNADTCGEGVCGESGKVGEVTCSYSEDVKVSRDTYAIEQATNSLFKEALADIEMYVQATYNAKIQAEQNACVANNATHSAENPYVWAKLKGKMSSIDNYALNGLGNRWEESNDLYGSFCRIKVSLRSSDPKINSVLAGKGYTSYYVNKKGELELGETAKAKTDATNMDAYFAAGDAFVCGGWLDQATIEKMAVQIANDSTASLEKKQKATKAWGTVAATLATGVGGMFLGDYIQSSVKQQSSALGSGIKYKNVLNKYTNNNKCTNYVADVTDKLKALPAKQEEVAESDKWIAYLSAYNTAVADGWGQNDITNTGLQTAQDALIEKVNAERRDNLNADYTKAKVEVVEKLGAISGKCHTESTFNANKGDNAGLGAGLGAAITAIAGGTLTGLAIDSAQKQKLTKEQEEAYNDFMETIGNTLSCYVGGNKVGGFGQVISSKISDGDIDFVIE